MDAAFGTVLNLVLVAAILLVSYAVIAVGVGALLMTILVTFRNYDLAYDILRAGPFEWPFMLWKIAPQMNSVMEQTLPRQLYQLKERLESAVKALNSGHNPQEVVQQDLVRALSIIDYLESL